MKLGPFTIIFFSLLITIAFTGCAEPPDVPNCVPLGSDKWPEFKKVFKTACAFDLGCREKMSEWYRYVDALRVSDRGWCTNTITEKEFFVDNEKNLWPEVDPVLKRRKTWSEIDATAVRSPSSSWAKIKAFFIKACKLLKSCAKNITTWERKFESVDEKLSEQK